MDKLALLKATLAKRKKTPKGDNENSAEDRAETSAQETAEDKGQSLAMAGENSAQKVASPKKGKKVKPVRSNSMPGKKPSAPFFQKAKTRGASIPAN